MEAPKEARKRGNEEYYHIENLRIARDFSKKLLEEFNELVRSITLFGSNTQDTTKKDSDIDLMIVLDNVSVFVSAELREAYRVIVNNLNENVGQNKIHIMTVNLSDLWDMARKGDPILINILRYGQPLFDRDLVEPLQYLLEIGRIRPTREAASNYTARAETLLEETQKHIQDAVLDLYYAVVDMVHATLMIQKLTPPSPKEMPELFRKTFSGTELEPYAKEIEDLYQHAKDIERRHSSEITGEHYDDLKRRTEQLIKDLKEYNSRQIQDKDIFEL